MGHREPPPSLFPAKAGVLHDPRGFEAFYPGARTRPGQHRPGVPEAKELGFTGDADLASWPAAVRQVATLYPERIVIPGHGGIGTSGAAFQHTLDLLTAAASRQNGKTVPAAAP